MPRRLLFLAAVAAAAVSVAPAFAKDPLAEKVKYTKADNAFAARVVLRPSELTTNFVKAPLPKGDSSFDCGVAKPDLSAFTITGEKYSGFEDKTHGIGVFAGAQVFASTGDARGDFVRSALPQYKACVEKMARDQGLHVTSSTFGRGAQVGERSVQYRVVGTVKTARGSVPVHVDLLAAQQGRVQVMLMLVALLRSPSDETLLLAAMASRATSGQAA